MMAKQNIDAFLKAGVDYIIINAAGCGATLKEYEELMHSDQEYASKAGQFVSKVRDIAEFLVEVGFEPPKGKIDAKVTYHDACHLAHAQKVRTQPRQLLRSIPGVELIEMRDSDVCCGSAGIYNLTHPDMAEPILEKKNGQCPSGGRMPCYGQPGLYDADVRRCSPEGHGSGSCAYDYPFGSGI